jgi:type IV pilus assembly protein PilX
MSNKITTYSINQKSRQSGAALIVGMIILLLLTLMGITAMKDIALQERMAGNLKDSSVSFESAEAGLREAIRAGEVASKAYDGTLTGYGQQITEFKDSSGNYVSEQEYWTAVFDWSTKSVVATQPDGTKSAPRYYVESIPIPSSTAIWKAGERAKRAYRITVKAAGASDRAQTIVQGTIVQEE